MKKFLSVFTVILLVFAICSIAAYADAIGAAEKTYLEMLKEMGYNTSDLTEEDAKDIYNIIQRLETEKDAEKGESKGDTSVGDKENPGDNTGNVDVPSDAEKPSNPSEGDAGSTDTPPKDEKPSEEPPVPSDGDYGKTPTTNEPKNDEKPGDDTVKEPDKTPSEPSTEPKTDGDTKITDELGNTVMEISEFFNNRILPFIISAASTFLGLLIVAVPYIKKAGKLNRLQGLYKSIKSENDRLCSLLETTDVDKLKATLEDILTEDLKKAIKNVKIDNEYLADVASQLRMLSAQMDAIINGATNAWAQSPAAVACLTSAPTETALKKSVSEVKALEDYIRETKGEEAEEIISRLKGE